MRPGNLSPKVDVKCEQINAGKMLRIRPGAPHATFTTARAP